MSLLSTKDSDSSSRPSVDQVECVEREEWKRRSRNLSEKKRRDHFNTLISQLGNMLTSTSRKMDKSTVLKGTIAFFKEQKRVPQNCAAEGDSGDGWKPPFLSDEEFLFLLLEAMDGFMIVLCPRGKILYISNEVTSLLGHSQDIVDTVIYDAVLPEDRGKLYKFLETKAQSPDDSSTVDIHISTCDSLGSRDYTLVRMGGYVNSTPPQSEGGFEESGSESGPVFVGTGRVMEGSLLRPMSLQLDWGRTLFSSRHSLDWKFLFLDHRAPPIIGYLPFELLGTSAYDYFHPDDFNQLAKDHMTLMEKGEGTSSPYRFLTKGQQWIWIETRYFITYHQWNSKPEFMVATHQLIGCGSRGKDKIKMGEGACVQGTKRKLRDIGGETKREGVKEEVQDGEKWFEMGGVHERLLRKQAELQRRIREEEAQLRLVCEELLQHDVGKDC